ncbi:MAG: AAA family ATPase [Desulfobacterales bacterium]|nr:AAA family ATPase [Desulfobacterales bacterium]
MIGQERAVQAIEFGLNMRSPGYNIFVTGAEGTGKSTIVRDLAAPPRQAAAGPGRLVPREQLPGRVPPARRRAAARPRAVLRQEASARLVNDLKKDIPRGFEDGGPPQEAVRSSRPGSPPGSSRSFRKIERFAAERSLHIDSAQQGVPGRARRGRQAPRRRRTYQELPRARRRPRSTRTSARCRRRSNASGRRIEKLNQQLHADIERLMNEVGRSRSCSSACEPVRQDFQRPAGRCSSSWTRCEADIVENFNLFMPGEQGRAAGRRRVPAAAASRRLQNYQVNVLVHRRADEGGARSSSRPTPPTATSSAASRNARYHGHGEHGLHPGDGGLAARPPTAAILIMEIESLLMHPYVWEALKRALQTKRLAIEDLPEESGPGTTSPASPSRSRSRSRSSCSAATRPSRSCRTTTREFNKIFKVRADFDQEVEHTPETEAALRALHRPGLPRGEAAAVQPPRAWRPSSSSARSTSPTSASSRIQFGRLLGGAEGGGLLGPAPARPGRLRSARGARLPGAPLPLQPLRAEGPRVLPRRLDPDRRRRGRGRADQRPGGLPDRRLRLRPAGAHHGRHVHGQARGDQHRARGRSERPHPRQGRADPVGLPRQRLRPAPPAAACRSASPSSRATTRSTATAPRPPSSTPSSPASPASRSGRASPSPGRSTRRAGSRPSAASTRRSRGSSTSAARRA